jgi:nitrate/nitrite-specific signal transduction histidine kinase
MAKAVVDPEELTRFIVALRRFNDATRGELTAVHRQFQRLGETWQDEEQVRFAESFQTMVKVVGRFIEDSERQVPVLTRKAEAIRAYLRPA